ncbi:MAG: hypothetical protein FWD71_11940 [Oscillospiraceae bacterium]|nr:hypothetical protein [Oscillospiraceae bacterium]
MEHKYIKEMFTRADLQQFREFLITGLDLDEVDKRTYSERLEKESESIVKRIKCIAKDDDELDEIYTEFGDATEAYMNVFTEIGIKIGARMLFQLLLEDK